MPKRLLVWATRMCRQTRVKSLEMTTCELFCNSKVSASFPVMKASLVEHFNKTLRAKIHTYLMYKRDGRYINALLSLVNAYNRAYHFTLDMVPKDVDKENAEELFVCLCEPRH